MNIRLSAELAMEMNNRLSAELAMEMNNRLSTELAVEKFVGVEFAKNNY